MTYPLAASPLLTPLLERVEGKLARVWLPITVLGQESGAVVQRRKCSPCNGLQLYAGRMQVPAPCM